MLSQKENIVSGNPYGSLEKNSMVVTPGVGLSLNEDGLITQTDLDLYTSSLASHMHHHQDHHLHHHHHLVSQSYNGSPTTGVTSVTTSSSSAASSGTTTSSSHPHVHFLAHHNQVQILDSSDGIIYPSIMTASGGTAHTTNTATLTRNSQQQQYLRS